MDQSIFLCGKGPVPVQKLMRKGEPPDIMQEPSSVDGNDFAFSKSELAGHRFCIASGPFPMHP